MRAPTDEPLGTSPGKDLTAHVLSTMSLFSGLWQGFDSKEKSVAFPDLFKMDGRHCATICCLAF
jgi:hypothetical protein